MIVETTHLAAVTHERQCVEWLAVDENVHLDDVRLLWLNFAVVERC